MTSTERLDLATRGLTDVAAASAAVAVLLFFLWGWLASELLELDERVVKWVALAIVFGEALFLLLCAYFALYVRVYMPLQGVA